MNTTVDVVCRYNKKLIETSLEWNPPDIYQQFTKKIIELENQAVKDALNKLGYLDPQQSAELLRALDNMCHAYRVRNGLDGAWDSELLDAQKLLEKYK